MLSAPKRRSRAAKTVLEFLDEEWDGDPALEGDARLLLAQASRITGDVEAALKEAENAGRIFARENHKSRVVTALLFAAETAWQARKVEETTRLVQQVMDAARAAADNDSLRHALSLAATLANLRGEYEKANAYLEEVVSLAPGAKETELKEEIQEEADWSSLWPLRSATSILSIWSWWKSRKFWRTCLKLCW